MSKNKFILIFVFILGFILRFYKLGEVPVGFHIDEAYFGYNAFSILQTGREMTGNFLPLNLSSFLFSPAGYSYFSIIPILLFNLNEYSVRFASALFGVLSLPVFYLLIKKIFSNFKAKENLALISVFLLSISPWHINLSRTATESVIVVFFLLTGIYLFLHWIEKNKIYYLITSFLVFFITLLTYQAPRSFMPIFIPLLILWGMYVNKISIKRTILSFLFYILFIIVPVLIVLTSPNLSFRIRTLSIFQNPQTQLLLDEGLREDGVSKLSAIEARVFHNKITNYYLTFSKNYFAHFSYDFLFTDSGLPIRYRIPSMGLLYFFDLPLIIFGLYYLVKNRKIDSIFILGWVLLSPVGSALTFDDIPNLQRTLMIVPPLMLISAFGLINILEIFNTLSKKSYIYKNLFIVFLSLLFIYNFIFYLHSYYIHSLVHRPWYRDEGYSQLVGKINSIQEKYKQIVITDSNSSPTIFLLFFNKINPKQTQAVIKQSGRSDYGNISFGKYRIVNEKCPLAEIVKIDALNNVKLVDLRGEKNVLYVNDLSCPIPKKGVKIISEIKRTDGTIAFRLLSLQ